jgi:hypothetical protein
MDDSNTFENLSSAGTFVLKTGSGFLHTITVNTTAAGAITVYNNTEASGKKIATIKASAAEQTFVYDINFNTGLTVVLAGASDITVSFT